MAVYPESRVVAVVAGRRKQFLGRHLMLKGKYADLLLEGRKKTTIRVGYVVPRYEEVIIHGHGRPLAKARVVKVERKRVSELTDEDARLDGFRSRGELVRALEKVYGELSPDDLVTIIHLEVVQRLDQLDPEDPYMGLEPADIARLGLRYLRGELSEEEVRILEDLTRTNSIRETAHRLYGSWQRRKRIRSTLRRVLRLLLEKGLVSAGKGRARGRGGRPRF